MNAALCFGDGVAVRECAGGVCDVCGCVGVPLANGARGGLDGEDTAHNELFDVEPHEEADCADRSLWSYSQAQLKYCNKVSRREVVGIGAGG
jgi:hypothetical protein